MKIKLDVVITTLLVVCAVPATSAPRITTQDLATLRDISGLSVSPDGRWAAFEIVRADPERNAYDATWHSLDLVTKAVRQIAEAGDLMPVLHQGPITYHLPPPAPVWSPDGVWLAYLRREPGSSQVWRVRRDGGSAEQLTHNDGDVRTVAYARDGRRLFFETEASQSQVTAALAAEGRTGFLYDQRFQPMHDRLPVRPSDVSLGAATQAHHTQSQIAMRRIWVYDLHRRQERPASESERAEFAALTTSPEPSARLAFRGRSAQSRGGALAWTEASDPALQGVRPPLTIVAQPTGATDPVVCRAVECTAERVVGLWWRNDEELLFIRREGYRQQDRALYGWAPSRASAPRLIIRTPDRFEADGSLGLDCALAQDRLLCLYEQPNYPRRLVAIDLNSGTTETLYDPNPEFAHFNLGPSPQRIAVRAESGAETYGYLVLPPRRSPGERLPLVMVTYRCAGFLRGGTGDEYPIYPLASAGFAVFCYDLPDDFDRMARLDAAAYTEWSRGPGVPMRHRIEETLDAAIEQLDRMAGIDPERVGVTGLSYGAETVGYALVHMPTLAAAISSGNPGPGPAHYSLLGQSVRDTFKAWGVGAPDETPERWREMGFSPNVSRVRAPLLINAADHEMLAALDPIVALEDAGRSVEMYVFPDEYHGKWQPAHRLAIYNRNIDWMNFWLRGVEDPVPAKAAQYQRWRVMRVKQCDLFGEEPDAPWYCRRDSEQSASQ